MSNDSYCKNIISDIVLPITPYQIQYNTNHKNWNVFCSKISSLFSTIRPTVYVVNNKIIRRDWLASGLPVMPYCRHIYPGISSNSIDIQPLVIFITTWKCPLHVSSIQISIHCNLQLNKWCSVCLCHGV